MYSSGRVGGRSRERERGNSERVKKKKKKPAGEHPTEARARRGDEILMSPWVRSGEGKREG